MIDLVYSTVTIIINKEQNGYVSPDEFNKIANLVQEKIYKNYFEDHNRDDNKDHSGLVSKGYGNLPFNQRQKIDQFAEAGTMVNVVDTQFFDLPEDLYLIEDDGIQTSTNIVVEEVERRELGYLANSIAKPTENYPVYARYSDKIKVYPSTLTGDLEIRYLRKPKAPKWTYFSAPDGNAFYNAAAADHQDFELHDSEFTNIVMNILMFFGINLREQEIIQVANTLTNEEINKENN